VICTYVRYVADYGVPDYDAILSYVWCTYVLESVSSPSTLKIEAISFSEKLVTTYKIRDVTTQKTAPDIFASVRT
jgi:hypothetical protein